MTPPDKYLYEYAVVRFVPRVDREEFINIGLVMVCKRQKWLRGKIYISPDKLSAFSTKCDIESLEAQAEMFTRKDVPHAGLPVEECYRWLTAPKNAILQTSASHPGMLCAVETDETLDCEMLLQAEFDRLFDMLVK